MHNGNKETYWSSRFSILATTQNSYAETTIELYSFDWKRSGVKGKIMRGDRDEKCTSSYAQWKQGGVAYWSSSFSILATTQNIYTETTIEPYSSDWKRTGVKEKRTRESMQVCVWERGREEGRGEVHLEQWKINGREGKSSMFCFTRFWGITWNTWSIYTWAPLSILFASPPSFVWCLEIKTKMFGPCDMKWPLRCRLQVGTLECPINLW